MWLFRRRLWNIQTNGQHCKKENITKKMIQCCGIIHLIHIQNFPKNLHFSSPLHLIRTHVRNVSLFGKFYVRTKWMILMGWAGWTITKCLTLYFAITFNSLKLRQISYKINDTTLYILNLLITNILSFFNSFYTTGLLIYHLKASKNIWFFDNFWGYGKSHWYEMGWTE